MLNKLPDFLDPIYAVKHNKHYVRRVKMSLFKRLVEQMESVDDREVLVDIRFYYDKALGFPAFEMKLEAVLNLQCQRSLKPFDFPVESKMKGIFTESMALIDDELPSDIEVFELESDNISLIELIEEELLLSVPMAAIDGSSEMAYQNTDDSDHKGSRKDSKGGSQESQSQKPNPFAVLQGLKK